MPMPSNFAIGNFRPLAFWLRVPVAHYLLADQDDLQNIDVHTDQIASCYDDVADGLVSRQVVLKSILDRHSSTHDIHTVDTAIHPRFYDVYFRQL